VACSACATMVGWGVQFLGIPFAAIANIIFVNNFALNCILTPLALALIYPRVKNMGLLYTDVLAVEAKGLSIKFILGIALMVVGAVGGLVIGNLISLSSLAPNLPVTLALIPLIACMVLAVILL
jgi:energy-coupling factor transport system substrate-specific component